MGSSGIFINKNTRSCHGRVVFLFFSFYLIGFSNAACAAASRAIGTRNGEQLT